MDEVMDIPQATIKKEIDDNFTPATKPNINYETQVFDSMEKEVVPIQPIKIEPPSYELEPNYSNQHLKLLSKGANIIGNDNKYLLDCPNNIDSLERKDIIVKTEHVESNLNKGRNKNMLLNIKEEVIEGDSENINSLDFKDIIVKTKVKTEHVECALNEETNKNIIINIKEEVIEGDLGNSVEVIRPKGAANSRKKKINVDVFKCDYCKYRTHEQRLLKLHLMGHENPAKRNKYKCEFCNFETTRLRSLLNRHMLQHKEPGEATMYKCDQCDYQTVYKDYLKSHNLKHKNPKEVEMYSCNRCDFKTIYKKSLQSHITGIRAKCLRID